MDRLSKLDRRSDRLRPARLSVMLTVPALAVLLTGCLSSGYQYISHSNADHTSLYFKIPSQWKVYDYSQIIESANGHLSNTQLSQIKQAQWLESFSAARGFTAKQSAAFGKISPTGATFAAPISTSDQDTFSLSTLRSLILGSDPVASGSGDNLLAYSTFVGQNGIRGSRFTVDIPEANGKIVTYGQVAMVDGATNWAYAIGIGCYASCWGPNEGLINQILKSWTVKER